ncbi:hypothetical protein DPMN_140668 [Dreissena polymorpha]|uniref:Uncharacterized protein n=1 Tax=Dreissena polymorpha TaxID=45954 RepID=A0A9D4G814_DREPO|nr:hypothetical protein DPMN_140668 [Dreissena polymorpha]
METREYRGVKPFGESSRDEPEVPLILTTNREKTNATWKTEYKQHYTESQANVKKQRNMENEDLNVPRETKTLGPSTNVQTTTKTTTTMNTTETTIDDASKTSESRAESTNAFQSPRTNLQSAYLHDGDNDFNETSYSPRATTSRQHGRHQMYRWPTINI